MHNIFSFVHHFISFSFHSKHKINGRKEVKYLLPVNILELRDLKPQQWVSLIHAKVRQLAHLTQTQAKSKFLEVLQMWPLFGSTFFYIKNVYDTRIHADCILAINKLGVYFLNKESHVRVQSLFSTRTSRI